MSSRADAAELYIAIIPQLLRHGNQIVCSGEWCERNGLNEKSRNPVRDFCSSPHKEEKGVSIF